MSQLTKHNLILLVRGVWWGQDCCQWENRWSWKVYGLSVYPKYINLFLEELFFSMQNLFFSSSKWIKPVNPINFFSYLTVKRINKGQLVRSLSKGSAARNWNHVKRQGWSCVPTFTTERKLQAVSLWFYSLANQLYEPETFSADVLWFINRTVCINN